jgi:hypothetical protein
VIAESRSPRQKAKVMTMMKPVSPFSTRVQIMPSGKTRAASLISSAMCTAESGPISEYMGPTIPTRQPTPCEGQPKSFLNSVKTAFAGCRGASAHNGICIVVIIRQLSVFCNDSGPYCTKIPKKPKTWMISITPSINGSFLAKNVLKRMAIAATAMIMSVACHALGT